TTGLIAVETGNCLLLTEKENVTLPWVTIPKEVRNSLRTTLQWLYQTYICGSILVEGGAKLVESFLKENLWDEIWHFQAPFFLGAGVPMPRIQFNISEKITILSGKIGQDIYWHYQKVYE
ncbi:MAG: dihydrofolate reductase family protein, partial [Bacteroidia bacterium]|nr:dihydrofolate reductase family protein [Bacteroidia bacterium]